MEWTSIVGGTVGGVISAAAAIWIRYGITELHMTFNSKMDRLLAVTEEAAYARGHQAGGDEARSKAEAREDAATAIATPQDTPPAISVTLGPVEKK